MAASSKEKSSRKFRQDGQAILVSGLILPTFPITNVFSGESGISSREKCSPGQGTSPSTTKPTA